MPNDDDWLAVLIGLGLGAIAIGALSKILNKEEQQPPKKCPYCGAEIRKWARECPRCRRPLNWTTQ